ncbi:MAG: hypothetical protein QM581_15585 [Pseudomonas sp.]
MFFEFLSDHSYALGDEHIFLVHVRLENVLRETPGQHLWPSIAAPKASIRDIGAGFHPYRSLACDVRMQHRAGASTPPAINRRAMWA